MRPIMTPDLPSRCRRSGSSRPSSARRRRPSRSSHSVDPTASRSRPTCTSRFCPVWTPIIARFTQLYLTDVDKKSHMPDKAQMQHWLVTFNGKSSAGTNLCRCVRDLGSTTTGDQLEGWALYLPDTDYVQSFIDFPPPPAAQVGFDSRHRGRRQRRILRLRPERCGGRLLQARRDRSSASAASSAPGRRGRSLSTTSSSAPNGTMANVNFM